LEEINKYLKLIIKLPKSVVVQLQLKSILIRHSKTNPLQERMKVKKIVKQELSIKAVKIRRRIRKTRIGNESIDLIRFCVIKVMMKIYITQDFQQYMCKAIYNS